MNLFMMIVIVFASLPVGPAAADSERGRGGGEKGIVSLPAGEVIHGDYFAYGERVEISGTVNGDVYAAGGQVLVDGRINGDLLAAAGAINVSGKVSQDARIAGGKITLNGEIGRNLTAAGGSVELTDSARIQGGLVVAGGSVSLAAPVGRDARVAAGNVTLSNTIKGNLEAATGDLRLTSRAVVAGALTYWSDQAASIDANAKVRGVVTQKAPLALPRASAKKIAGTIAGLILLVKAISFISTLILGALLIHFFPVYNRAAVSTLKKRPWASLGVGFFALFVTPMVVVILLVTVVGAPLALILTAVYFIGVYLARIVVILWVGAFIFERFGKEVRERWALVVGLVVYSLLTFIPFIGALGALFAILFGLGAILLADRALYAAAREKELI